jgi:hypothetical protein
VFYEPLVRSPLRAASPCEFPQGGELVKAEVCEHVAETPSTISALTIDRAASGSFCLENAACGVVV